MLFYFFIFSFFGCVTLPSIHHQLALHAYVQRYIIPAIKLRVFGNPGPGGGAVSGAVRNFYPTYYLTRFDYKVPSHLPPLERLWLQLYVFLHHNSLPVSSFFHLPPSATVEIGNQIMLS